MKAGIYIRCSQEAKDRDTLLTQREDNIKTCEKNGWPWELFEDDGVSVTKKLEGPGFKALMAKVTAGEIDNVVVWKGDRFGRNILESLINARDYLLPHGCKITIAGRILDLENPDDYFQFGIDQLVSTRDAQNIKRTTSRTKLKRITEGKLTQGKLPYGLRWVSPKASMQAKVAGLTGKEWEVGVHIVKEEAENVRRVFDLFLQGHNQTEIARMIPKFYQSKVSLILRTECYWTGKHHTRYGGKVGTVEVPILIDPETAEAARKKLQRKDNYGRPKFPHLLKARLVCEDCGRTCQTHNNMVGDKLFAYYLHYCKDGRGVRLPAEEWDNLFWKRIVYAADHPEDFPRSMQGLQGSEYGDKIKGLTDTLQGYQKERESRKRKKENLLDQLEDATDPKVRRDIMERLESHHKGMDDLEFKIKKVEQEIANLDKLKEIASTGGLAGKIKNLQLRENMSFEEKRKALEKLEAVVYFMPMNPKKMVRRRPRDFWVDGSRKSFPTDLVRRLKGIPLRAEGLLEIDFAEKIDAR